MDPYTATLFNDKTDEWVRDYVLAHFEAIIKTLGAFTIEEYARLLRVRPRTARDQVTKLMLAEKISVSTKYRRDQYGALRARQVYQYKEAGWNGTA